MQRSSRSLRPSRFLSLVFATTGWACARPAERAEPRAGVRPAAVPSAATPEPAVSRVDTAHTVVLQLTSRTFGNARAIRVHLPPGYHAPANASRRYPVLYMSDGFAVFSPRAWNAPHTLDSLTQVGAIAPIILVGIDNAASIPGAANPIRDRANEYLPYPDRTEPELPAPQGGRYPEFLTTEVMPLVEGRFRLTLDAAGTAVGGSSYGGIAALYTVLRHSGRFGGLLLESTPVFLFDRRLIEESAALNRWPRTVYIGIGTRETDDASVLAAGAGALDSLMAVIRGRSPETRVVLNRAEGATHTSAAWRERLPVALVTLFGRGR